MLSIFYVFVMLLKAIIVLIEQYIRALQKDGLRMEFDVLFFILENE